MIRREDNALFRQNFIGNGNRFVFAYGEQFFKFFGSQARIETGDYENCFVDAEILNEINRLAVFGKFGTTDSVFAHVINCAAVCSPVVVLRFNALGGNPVDCNIARNK